MESGEVTKISVSPKCPNLSTLFLNKMWKLYSMPPDFLVHMKALKVLNLEMSREVEMLPDSISSLVNLRALCLNDCSKIRRVPSLAKLTLLRILKLSRIGIEELRHGMEMLVNLKCLDLSGSLNFREVFPNGLIPKWSLLEELYLFLLTEFYEVEGEMGFVEELLSLKHSEALAFNFTCPSQFNSYVESPAFSSLKKFDLVIQAGIGNIDQKNVSIGKIDIPVNVLIIPQNIALLNIREFEKLMSLNELIHLGCLELRQCEIDKCQNMEYVLSFLEEEVDCVVLPRLEILYICGFYKLQSFCKGIPTPGTLLNLKVLRIWQCHSVKNVFSSSRLLQLLENLEKVFVWNCDKMEELIASEEEDENDITSMPTISLLKWKNLNRFGYSLEEIWILKCDELEKLPRLNTPSLKEITGSSQEWWDSLEWDDNVVDGHTSLRQRLQPLFQVSPYQLIPIKLDKQGQRRTDFD